MLHIFLNSNILYFLTFPCYHPSIDSKLNPFTFVKGLVAEFTPPHAQSTWEFRGERVRTAGLVACCNYF